MQLPLFPSLVVLALLAPLPCQGPHKTFEFHHENVLGTSMDLQVQATSQPQAQAVETRVLAEIRRLDAILSTWCKDSEVTRLHAKAGAFHKASPELLDVLNSCDRWYKTSKGAFNPAAALFTPIWKDAEAKQKLPSSSRLAKPKRLAKEAPWEIERGKVKFFADTPITLDGIAKGYILDKAGRAGMQIDGVQGLVLNIGGDIVVRGQTRKVVGIANPSATAENARPLVAVLVRDAAVATSAGYARGFTIDDKRYSHIIDPRTGKPARKVASATVIAPTAAEADALATTLNILTAEQGVKLVEERKNTECLIVTPSGLVRESNGWQRLVAPDKVAGKLAPAPSSFPKGFELRIDFEINRPGSGGRRGSNGRGRGRGRGGSYKRPYIVIWVEDKDKKPVRTLCLWFEGFEWLRDLRVWYRKEGSNNEMVDVMSRATRPPGSYSLVWDGRDDRRQPVPPGTYTVLIVAAREHGTHKVMRKKVVIGDKPFRFELDGNIEISSATLTFGKKSARKKKRKGL